MILRDIHRVAHATPSKIALIHNDQALTYRQFLNAIMDTRAALQRAHVPRAGIAGISLSALRNVWPVMLALQSLGLTTLVMPDLATLALLRPADLRCVITSAAWRHANPQEPRFDLPEIEVGPSFWRADGGDVPGACPIADPAGEHIVMTSGTTGIHKMVRVSQAAEQIHAAQRHIAYELTADTVEWVGNFQPWTSIGYHVPLAIWTRGGTCAFYEGSYFWPSFTRPIHTHMIMTPGFLADAIQRPPGALHFNPNLHLTIGAGAIPRAVALAAMQRLTPRLYSNLTTTEAGLICHTRVPPEGQVLRHNILPSRDLQIVDDEDRPVPVGRTGSVRVRIMDDLTGYMNDPASTRQFFRDGFFYTGDLGALDADGCLLLKGRAGDVINIGGEKIALMPIETAIENQLTLRGVCILSAPGGSRGDIAHVVLETAALPSPTALESLRRGPLRQFPDIRFHARATLPRNAASKLLRHEIRRDILGEYA